MRARMTDRRHCDLGISREISPVIGDSLYRTVAHTVIPLNGKCLFAVACDAGSSLFTLHGTQGPVDVSPS